VLNVTKSAGALAEAGGMGRIAVTKGPDLDAYRGCPERGLAGEPQCLEVREYIVLIISLRWFRRCGGLTASSRNPFNSERPTASVSRLLPRGVEVRRQGQFGQRMRVEFQVAGGKEECACRCEVQDVVCPLARTGAVQNKRAAGTADGAIARIRRPQHVRNMMRARSGGA
jgi:hypothetical protein